MQHAKYLSREEAIYRQFQECLASLNRAWAILSALEDQPRLEGQPAREDQPLSPALSTAALQMALVEYGKPFRESGSGEHKRHSLGLPLADEEDHLLHRYLLEQRDRILTPSAQTLTGSAVYAGQQGEGAAGALVAAPSPQVPPLADIKALIERILDVFYAQLPRLQRAKL